MLLRITKQLVSILEHWLLSIRAKNKLCNFDYAKKTYETKASSIKPCET
jgi:hypothetical protein